MRYRLRTLLIGVALVACLAAAWSLGQRRGALLIQAAQHAQREREQLREAEKLEADIRAEEELQTRPVLRYEGDTEESYRARVGRWARLRAHDRLMTRRRIALLRSEAATRRQQAARFAALRREYEQAARFPWLSAPPQ